jgi:catechol 2,3-dioxygenase-like lactoylglutathione lyase family enzyme
MPQHRLQAADPTLRPTQPPAMLSHLAYYTHDVAATTEFYTEVLGLGLANVVMGDSVPSTGDEIPYFHIFLRLGDGSTIAFFEAPDIPARSAPSHRAYELFDHLALEVPDVRALDAWQQWLEANDLEVIGPVDHGIIRSIYFTDPVNGFRLELTAHTPAWNDHPEYTADELRQWVMAKERAAATGADVAMALTEHVRLRASASPDRVARAADDK